MIAYLATVMTIAGVAGFTLSLSEHERDQRAGVTALKIASALLAAVVTIWAKQ